MTCLLSCKDFLTWLNDHLDDPADRQVRTHVEEHVNNCPNCWVIYDTTKKTIQVYKGMEPRAIPAEVHDRLMSALTRKLATGAKPPATH